MHVYVCVGTMMGVTNMIGTVPGIVSPYLAGAIVEGRVCASFLVALLINYSCSQSA